jgi:O-antigen/teichoic acid export membrane protein
LSESDDEFGNDRQIFRNSAVLAGARVIERATNLILAFMISRELGVSALGAYATATAYFALISVAGEAGVTNLLIREIAKDRSRTNSLLVHASVLAAGCSAVLMGIAWSVFPHLDYSPELKAGLMVLVFALLPGTLNTVQEAVFVVYQKVEFETWTTLAGSIATVVASVYLLESGHGVVSLLVAFVVAEYAVTIVYFVLINHSICRMRFEFHVPIARELIRDLMPFTGSSLIAAAFARPEIIMLSLVSTPAEVGYYSAAAKVVEVWQFIPQTYMVNVFPVLSRSYALGDGRMKEFAERSLRYLLLLGFPISAGLLFAARPIILTLYGSGFSQSVPVLRLLAPSVAIYCVHSVMWRVLSARGRQARVLRVQVLSLVVRVFAGYVLISQFGALGAAVVLPLALALHTLLLDVALHRDETQLRILRVSWEFLVAAAVMGIMVGVLATSLNVFVLVSLGVVAYGLLVLLLIRVTPSRRVHDIAVTFPQRAPSRTRARPPALDAERFRELVDQLRAELRRHEALCEVALDEPASTG